MNPTTGNDVITVGLDPLITEIVDALAGDDLVRVLAGTSRALRLWVLSGTIQA